jgi:hypothetical protein
VVVFLGVGEEVELMGGRCLPLLVFSSHWPVLMYWEEEVEEEGMVMRECMDTTLEEEERGCIIFSINTLVAMVPLVVPVEEGWEEEQQQQ